MLDPSKTQILLGPPGTGKTTRLLSIMEAEMRGGVDPRKVGFMAFTRKAADVAKSRAMEKFTLAEKDLPFFRTLHSLAFRQLGMKRDQVLQWGHYKELGEKLGMELRSHKNVEDGTTYGMTKEERMMFLEGLSRIKREDLRSTWADSDEEEIDWWELERYARALREYKENRLVVDYTDMIDQFVEQSNSVAPALDVLLIDEAQDLNPGQWEMVERLAEKTKRIYLAGDDDQCQPPGSMVETTIGPVPIEKLNPSVHRLVSWRRDTHCVHGKNSGGFEFEISCRHYAGAVLKISAGGSSTLCTPDHRWFVRFKKSIQEDRSIRAVYVMRKGSKFRIGECQLFGPQGGFHLWVRSRLENADAVWILKLVDSRPEARTIEQILSARYGLPQITFNDPLADIVFDSLDTQKSADLCLKDRDLMITKPFFTAERAESKRGGTPIFELEACNIHSAMMEVPLPHERKDAWAEVHVAPNQYSGRVFSLNVRPHHTYVVDGLVTKNCIYKWAGADVRHFINLQGRVEVLDQSHRVPARVHSLAESIAKQIRKRRKKEYKPRDFSGDIRWYGDPEEVDMSKETGTWLLLARNGYLLSGLEDMCVRNGFSFESVSRSPLQSDSLKALKSWENLRKGNSIPVEDAMNVMKFATPGKGIQKDTRERLRKASQESFVTLHELRTKFGVHSQGVWFEFLDRIPTLEAEYFRAALKRQETLFKKPRITISTIHAAKGGEAQNVMILTDMSYRTFTEMQKHPDDEYRTWYVGITRCLETLHIIAPRTNLCFDL